MTRQLKHHGRILSDLDLVILERLESLEHWSNQHDILLTGLIRDMNQKLELKQNISTGTVGKST